MHLIEFQNSRHITLRGVLMESSDATSKTVVVCVPGFEGVSSTAPKFVKLTNELLALSSPPIAAVFRYDPTGMGLSDGDYLSMTIDTLMDDLTQAMNYLLNNYTSFIFIAHSLGSCVISQYLKSPVKCFKLKKIILLAPALNQCELHRYWYMHEMNRSLTWENFQKNFKESDFQKYFDEKANGSCKPLRAHRILYQSLRSFTNKDFSFLLNDYQNEILHIHGDRDPVVPIESVKDQFRNSLILNTDDHDLEQPDILEQWTKKAIEFISH